LDAELNALLDVINDLLQSSLFPLERGRMRHPFELLRHLLSGVWCKFLSAQGIL